MGSNPVREAVALAVAGLGASAAHADTLLTETLTVGQLLQSGGSGYSNTFSIASLLAQNNLSNDQVLGVTLTAYGYSDATVNQSTSNNVVTQTSAYSTSVLLGYYSYSCGW